MQHNEVKGYSNIYTTSDNGKEASLVVNGELYNHKEIEHKYQLACSTESDCECILRLWMQSQRKLKLFPLQGFKLLVMVSSLSVLSHLLCIFSRPLILQMLSMRDCSLVLYWFAPVTIALDECRDRCRIKYWGSSV